MRGMDLYALHCAECHGSRGQGEIQEGASKLDQEYIRGQDESWLYKVIARGRDNTDMRAFHLDEGGSLNRQQIESLIAVLKVGSWDEVAVRVEALDMIPEEEMTLAAASALQENPADHQPIADDTESLAGSAEQQGPETVMVLTGSEFPYDPPSPHPTDGMSGRQLYKQFCEECHGQRGRGTEDAPALEALNAIKIAKTVRDGPEDMDAFTHEDIPDRQLNTLIDYVLSFHPDSQPRTDTLFTLP